MEWFVYILKAKTGRYYSDITQDINKRIHDHERGKGSKFIIDQGLSNLIYISHPYNNKSEARKREIQIKGWRKDKKEKLINKEWL